ncbi:hypothetical protein Tco_1119630, partial [Tanacetum coccineum]
SKGKDGRKVQFDSEDLFDEKFETNGNGKSNGKSSSSKGGKGDKVGASKKEPPPLVLKVEQGFFTCILQASPLLILKELERCFSSFNVALTDEDMNKGFNKVYSKGLGTSLSKVFRRHAALFKEVYILILPLFCPHIDH